MNTKPLHPSDVIGRDIDACIRLSFHTQQSQRLLLTADAQRLLFAFEENGLPLTH